MSDVAVTGATGLLGGNVVAALREAGHRVRATRRATSKVDHLAHLDVRWFEADLDDTAALASAFDGCDAVLHCAGGFGHRPAHRAHLQRINVDGTQHVIDAVRRAGAGRLVHCSSTVAVGLSVDGETPADERSPWNLADYGLDGAYARSKHEAEARVQAAVADGLDAVIVNPGNMYGALDAGPSSGQLILDVVEGRVPGLTEGRNCFADAGAVARGMIAAWQRGAVGQRYILGGENRTYAEMERAIAAIAGVRPPRLRLPHAAVWLAGAVGDGVYRLTGRETGLSSGLARWATCRRFIFTSARAEAELGYVPGSPDDGVRAALRWFAETGRL